MYKIEYDLCLGNMIYALKITFLTISFVINENLLLPIIQKMQVFASLFHLLTWELWFLKYALSLPYLNTLIFGVRNLLVLLMRLGPFRFLGVRTFCSICTQIFLSISAPFFWGVLVLLGLYTFCFSLINLYET